MKVLKICSKKYKKMITMKNKANNKILNLHNNKQHKTLKINKTWRKKQQKKIYRITMRKKTNSSSKMLIKIMIICPMKMKIQAK